MARFIKYAILNLLAFPGVARALSSLTNTNASIFMLHRFAVPDLGLSGHDPRALRRNLAHLRKRGYDLISLEDLLLSLRNGQPLKRAVAFTIDDGYFDHAEIAAPIFAEFDCPLTCFLTTGFLDGNLWLWWDRLLYILENTQRHELKARVGGQQFVCRWNSPETRRSAWWSINLRCQDASEADRLACIEDLRREAEVDVPKSPPPRFAPMTWETARRLESQGIRFGPHTVTHPVLGTTSAAQADWEIIESWRRLTTEVARPVPIFCYPNGRAHDVGAREISTVHRLGLWGGLMAHPGKLNAATSCCRIPRFGYSDSLPQLLKCLSGVEKMKLYLRERIGL